MAKTAEVWIWSRRVGVVLWDESRTPAMATFEFDPEFCKIGLQIAPLTMPAEPGRIYAFQGLQQQAFKHLPPCLSDSLPDDFGHAVIDAWLAQQGRDPKTFTPVERLLYIGKRGMGALEFREAIGTAESQPERLQMDSLVALAGRILEERKTQFDGLKLDAHTREEDRALRQLFQIGSSAGGARPKAIIAINDETGELCSGQLDAPQGYSYWLLKFDVTQGVSALGDPAGFGRIEYAYYLMARDAGIEMMECRLHEEGPRAHFMTRRFDRLEDGDRVHIQTLCAMDEADYTLPGAYSYEQALQVARDLGLSRTEQIQFFRRMVFNVIARNQDDHTRNHAFQLWRDGVWKLTPAYDLCWSYRPDSPWVSQHQMSINGKRDNFVLDDLLAVGRQITRFDGRKVVMEVVKAVSQWREFAAMAKVDAGMAEAIAATHRLYLG